MKKTVFTVILSVITLGMAANPIDKETALQIANSFMTEVSTRSASHMHKAPVSHQLTYKDIGFDKLHAFSDDTNGGFVIVAADDRLAQPVLAYSETDFVNMHALPEATQMMMLSYSEQIAHLPPDYVAQAPTQREVVYPLLRSMWHQYLPFCYDTPYDSNAGRNTLVGCVALTLSQLMYYWKYPSGTTRTIPAYTTGTGYDMPALPPTTFDYSKMHPNYEHVYSRDEVDGSDPSIQEVCKLMKYTGCALKMNYSTSGSAAVFDPDTIAKYFNFDKGCRYLLAGNYPHEIWEEMVYNELKAGRPVPYSAGAIGNQNHQFIIDGYDGNGYFHANIGEIGRGSSNQYYLLGVMDDTRDQFGLVEFSGYNVSQAGIFGFQPDKGNDPVPVVSVDYGDYSLSKTSYTRTSSSSDFKSIVLKGTMKRHDSNGLGMDYGWGLYQDGVLKKVVYSATTSDTSIPLTKSFNMGSGLPLGTYQFFPIFRNHGASEWETYLEYKYTDDTGEPMRHFTAKVEAKKLTIGVSSREPNITIDKVEYYAAVEGERLAARAYLTNGGTNYENLLFFWIDGEMRTGVGAYVDPGKSDYVDFRTAAPSRGTHNVKITTDYEGNDVVFTGKLTITAAPTYKLETSALLYGVTQKDFFYYEINDKIDVILKIKNVGTTTYSNILQGFTEEYLKGENNEPIGDEDEGYPRFNWTNVWMVNLAPGESIEIPVSLGKEVFRPNDYLYSIIFSYNNNNENFVNIYGMSYFCYTDKPSIVGDVNGDGYINMQDVTTAINYMLGKGPMPFSFGNADALRDGLVNMSDVTQIINIILGK